MYFKILVLVLALPFLLKANDAMKIANTFDEQDLAEIPKFALEVEDDGKSNKVAEEYKRTLESDGANSKQSFAKLSLKLAKMHVLEEILRKKKAISSLSDTVNGNSKDKCSKIVKVGEPIVHHHSGSTYGSWMRDPLGLLGPGKIWYMNSYYGNKVLEFESMDHFKAGEISKTYILPYYFDGTGAVVYGRYLYYNRANSYYIVQYDLTTQKLTRQVRPHSSIKPRTYYYQWSSRNTMDLSVDESGLWVLYSYSSYSGKLCASQLDPLTMSTLRTYCGISSESMKTMGNAFVACGVVYSIDSYSSTTTTINYAYDTARGSKINPKIKFINRFGYNSMVTYNPREKVLYAWDKNRQITYPLEFED
ncbi:Hypothetical predicted protein [Paramuricea clavata]|uniref:Uncharacterized protein n=2 Tax=Paramuricea clavata TaxID=317549 RepID=A0A6S7LHL2_PARCT|nr:Hypothetical predicted protein [Paramuricea clavata]